MCRQYPVVYWCAHVKYELRVCHLGNNCRAITSNSVIAITSHCLDCIQDPIYPTPEQQILIQLPELDRLLEAERLWDRLTMLFYGTGRGRDEPDKPYPKHESALPEEDLSQLYYWLQILQESRRTRESWRRPTGSHTSVMDKEVLKDVLKFILFNEIYQRERGAVAPDQGNRPNLLTKVELEDLEADHRNCPICYEPFGDVAEDQEAEPVVKLPCGHVFDEICIISSFEQVDWSCPYCRQPYDRNQFRLNRSPKVLVSPWWMQWLRRPAAE